MLRAESGGEVARQRFIITVFREAESLPEFTSSPPTTSIQEGQTYTYSITVDAADGVMLSAPDQPAWLSLTDAGDGTATLSGTAPDVAADTAYDVRLRATGTQGSSEQVYQITVEDVPA